MEKLLVKGKTKLNGKVCVQTSKNAVLPILAASILTDKKVIIKKCPKIIDVLNMIRILKELGCVVQWEGDNIIIDSSGANKSEIPQNLAKELRSSIFMLGSILSRFHKAKVAYPGGCDIGIRPIDLHIKGLSMLNVKIEESGGTLYCEGKDLKGAVIHLDCPSVGATENIIMASVLAKGETIIQNAAKEPEIVDLQNFINKMGGRISGAGSSIIHITGVDKLQGVEYQPIPDRIAAGTYLIGAAMTGGSIELSNCCTEHIYSLITKLKESTCKIDYINDKIYLKAAKRLQSIHTIETMPYPGFPTDLQAQMLSLTTIAKGTSIIIENIFETRYKHVAELNKMGAKITVRDRMAIVRGVKSLYGTQVCAHDLRGGAALLLAAVSAEGVTEISDVFHIDRGYENMTDIMISLGADIKRVNI
jgi:UDP-N-acetylglucosamine 1-carboxyvinyltransferase